MNGFLKLLKVQQELKAPKNQRNNFGNYSYRSAEDILEAVKPLCNEVKMLITLSERAEEINGETYMRCKATAYDAEDGQVITYTESAVRESKEQKGMVGPQISGSAISYVRKYCIGGLLNIDNSELDPDATNTHGKDEDVLFKEEPKKEMKRETKKTTKKDFDWFDSTLKNTQYMMNCLDEEDFIKKTKEAVAKIGEKMSDEQEKALRTQYQNQKAIESLEFDASIFN